MSEPNGHLTINLYREWVAKTEQARQAEAESRSLLKQLGDEMNRFQADNNNEVCLSFIDGDQVVRLTKNKSEWVVWFSKSKLISLIPEDGIS